MAAFSVEQKSFQIVGDLISQHLTSDVIRGSAKGQQNQDFGFSASEELADEIAIAWEDAKAYWSAFQRSLARAETLDVTALTRDQWVLPLLSSFGYDPFYTSQAEVIDGKMYSISHRAGQRREVSDLCAIDHRAIQWQGSYDLKGTADLSDKPPLHIIGCRVGLEELPPSNMPQFSAHTLLQDYLNRTEHLWGVVTNGLRWRLLRDCVLIKDLSYLEFDLEQILTTENYADFCLFFRLCHRSRLPEGREDAARCLLEVYHQDSLGREGLEKTAHPFLGSERLDGLPLDTIANLETLIQEEPAVKLENPKTPEIPASFKRLSLPARQSIFKFLRLGTGLGVFLVLAFHLWRSQTSVVSHQAYINGAILSVHAPIEGQLIIDNLTPGQSLKAGAKIAQIKNIRTPDVEVDRQQLISQLSLNQAQLQLIREKIDKRRQLLAEFSNKLDLQNVHQNTYDTQQVKQYESQVRNAQAALNLAQLEENRYSTLAKQGAISQERADQANTAAKQAMEVLQSVRANLKQAQAQYAAGANGLQLDGAKTFSYPEIRTRELNSEIDDLERQVQATQAQINQDRIKIANITQQLTLKQKASVLAPIDSVVWSVDKLTGGLGEHVNSGEALFKLLDCKQVWVDSFMAEEDVRKLQIGSAVKVRLLTDGGQELVEGQIQSIRSGVGRIETGRDVALPPLELVKRAVAVRVMISPKDLKPQKFCNVGRSVEVVVP